MPVCMSPITVQRKSGTGTKVDVPCGKCPACLDRRVSEWSFRLMQQDKISSSAWFVTLTYNTDHVPLTKNGFMSLQFKDVQKYMKRLRLLEKEKLSYYYCGEYGTKKRRPHYHMIIFNATVQNIIDAWMLDGKPIGDVYFGEVTGASVGYVLKYINKPQKHPLHKNDDTEAPRAFMSKGIGANYLTPEQIRWHRADLDKRMHLMVGNKKVCSMPRYYKTKIYNPVEREQVGQKALELMQARQLLAIQHGWTLHEDNEAKKAAFSKQKRSARERQKFFL